MTNIDPTPPLPPPTPMLTGKTYDRVKQIVQLWIPAFSTLYFTLGSLWDFPNVEKVIGTLAAFATFGGVILGLSSRTYNNSDARFAGNIVIHEKEDGGKLYSLEMNGDPNEQIDPKKTVTFKVGSAFPPPE